MIPHCTNSLPFLSGSELTVPFNPMEIIFRLSPGMIWLGFKTLWAGLSFLSDSLSFFSDILSRTF